MTSHNKLAAHSKITVASAMQAMIRAGVSNPSQYLTGLHSNKNTHLKRSDANKIKKYLLQYGKIVVRLDGISSSGDLRIRLLNNRPSTKINGSGKGRTPSRPNWVSPFMRPEVQQMAREAVKRNRELRKQGLI